MHSHNYLFFKVLFIVLISLWSTDSIFSQRPFITIWNSAEEGLGDSTQIVIPGQGDYTYTWSHVENEEINGTGYGSDTTTITFPEPGRYSLSITPDYTNQNPFHRIQFEADKQHPRYVSYPNAKLSEIAQWGDIPWSSFSHAFHGCERLGKITAEDVPDLSRVKNISAIFASCGSLYIYNQLNAWDMSNVEDISYMFCNIIPFNVYIGDWDVSSVKNMEGLFLGAFLFNQDIGNWDVSNVENMEATFGVAGSFNQDLTHWDVSNVKSMAFLFEGATYFFGDISTWDVSSVEDMTFMFKESGSVSDISNWDVGNVKYMANIFYRARNINQDLGKWNLSSLQHSTRSYNDFSFDGSGMDCKNYSKTIQGWADNPNTPGKIVIHGGEYSRDISYYRDYLIYLKGWEFEYDREGDCSITVSVKDVSSDDFNIYPNPVQDYLFIENPERIIDLHLIDVQGRNVLNQITRKDQIDLSALPQGLYFLSLVMDNGKVIAKKVLKN